MTWMVLHQKCSPHNMNSSYVKHYAIYYPQSQQWFHTRLFNGAEVPEHQLLQFNQTPSQLAFKHLSSLMHIDWKREFIKYIVNCFIAFEHVQWVPLKILWIVLFTKNIHSQTVQKSQLRSEWKHYSTAKLYKSYSCWFNGLFKDLF